MYLFELEMILSEIQPSLQISYAPFPPTHGENFRYVAQLSISHDRWLMPHGNSSYLLPASSISKWKMSQRILIHSCQIYHHTWYFITRFLIEIKPHDRRLLIIWILCLCPNLGLDAYSIWLSRLWEAVIHAGLAVTLAVFLWFKQLNALYMTTALH